MPNDVVEAIARDESHYWIADGGPPAFKVADLQAPVGAELSDDPAAQALRDFAADPGGAEGVPTSGWRVLARSGREVLFACEEDGEHYLVRVERRRGGTWEYAESRYYFESFQAIRDGNPASSWCLDPAADPPGPTDIELRVLVTEVHCASGRDAVGRIERPDVLYSAEEVRIVAYVTPLPGTQKCPGNPPTPAVFVLPEPLGDRRLVDAGEYRL
jgi:hypothetical protein